MHVNIFIYCVLDIIFIQSLVQVVLGELTNDRPIVGMMAQENTSDKYLFIPMPYVKFVEMGGARVVPIFVGKDKEYYRRMVNQTNGLFLPGGFRNITSSLFATATELLYDYAMEANDRGEYYPIWGSCQGLQILTVIVLKKHHSDSNPYLLTHCNHVDVATNLDFAIQPNETTMFAQADESIIRTLTTENATANYHFKCISPASFYESKLNNTLKIVSTSNDINGTKFVSTFESINASRPLYGLQWHPEKIPFEFKQQMMQQHIPHSASAVRMSQYMANFFVNECRKNFHKFPSSAAENEVIIYNSIPHFNSDQNMLPDPDMGEYYSQMYHFEFNHATIVKPYLVTTISFACLIYRYFF